MEFGVVLVLLSVLLQNTIFFLMYAEHKIGKTILRGQELSNNQQLYTQILVDHFFVDHRVYKYLDVLLKNKINFITKKLTPKSQS